MLHILSLGNSLHDNKLYHMPRSDMCELANHRNTGRGSKRNCEVVSRNSIVIFMNTMRVRSGKKSSETLTLKTKFISEIYFLYDRKSFPYELSDLSNL